MDIEMDVVILLFQGLFRMVETVQGKDFTFLTK